MNLYRKSETFGNRAIIQTGMLSMIYSDYDVQN